MLNLQHIAASAMSLPWPAMPSTVAFWPLAGARTDDLPQVGPLDRSAGPSRPRRLRMLAFQHTEEEPKKPPSTLCRKLDSCDLDRWYPDKEPVWNEFVT